jgi:hypothetical protein
LEVDQIMTLEDEYVTSNGGATASQDSLSPLDQLQAGIGVYTFAAEFCAENRIVRAELTSPEGRLSDHLNSSAPSIEMRPTSLVDSATRTQVDLSGTFAHFSKAQLLFVIPLTEPQRPDGMNNPAWKPTSGQRCWAGIGPYRVVGIIHTDAGRDPSISLRLLDKQFLPLTDTSVVFPDGSTHTYPTVIINRHQVDVLALKEI